MKRNLISCRMFDLVQNQFGIVTWFMSSGKRFIVARTFLRVLSPGNNSIGIFIFASGLLWRAHSGIHIFFLCEKSWFSLKQMLVFVWPYNLWLVIACFMSSGKQFIVARTFLRVLSSGNNSIGIYIFPWNEIWFHVECSIWMHLEVCC